MFRRSITLKSRREAKLRPEAKVVVQDIAPTASSGTSKRSRKAAYPLSRVRPAETVAVAFLMSI